jgi:hypothetical protein
MSEGKFDPSKHLSNKVRGGAEYLEVKWRLVWLRSEHPDAAIATELVRETDDSALFKASVSIPGGGSATGFGSETARDFGDFIEKAETKAVGRALAMLGYGTQFTGLDLAEGDRIVDTPVDRPAPTRATNTPRAGATPGREPAPRSAAPAPGPTHERPAAVPSAAGPPSPAVAQALVPNGAGGMRSVDVPMDDDLPAKPAKRAPTVAEALTAARNEALSDKARQYAAVKGLEAAATRDEAAEVYTQLLRVVPDAEAFKAAYVERNTALGQLEEVPF